MCIDCANYLQALSNFTSGCFFAGDGTLPLSDLENGVKLDPEPIETTSNPKSLMETEIKCSFCTKTRGRDGLISLRVSKENKFLANVLEQHISETNSKNTEEFLTCNTCLKALEGVLSVILKCLEVEEKISKYVELEGTDDNGQVELKKVQQFIFRPIIKLEGEPFSINKLEGRCDQIQEERTTMEETDIKVEKQLSNTELIIKTEVDDVRSEQSDCDGFQEPFIENKTPNDLLHVSVVLSGTEKSNGHTKQKHLLPQRETFHCNICPYVTKCEGLLKDHLLVHKRPSKTKMFKCELCAHQSKRKRDLTIHSLTHKSPSEIKMFKCALCSYEAKLRKYLRAHLLTHKTPSDIKMFKCEMCLFETKYKRNLDQHLLAHKSPSEIKMFKCDLCTYRTVHKHSLKRHSLTHKSPLMFKCALCNEANF